MAESWVRVCETDVIDREDVMRFDHGGRTFAIYRDPKGQFYATDGRCTHQKAHLAKGLVMGFIIECPLHNGRFDYRTGKATGAPACVDLAIHPVRVEAGSVMLCVGDADNRMPG
jgi:3-phenylpropionate/trans-cinnamate dioxygenase ferredoxin subunit